MTGMAPVGTRWSARGSIYIPLISAGCRGFIRCWPCNNTAFARKSENFDAVSALAS